MRCNAILSPSWCWVYSVTTLSQTAADLRTQSILHGRALPILLRMATPNVIAFLVQASVSMTEVWYVGQLGTTSLAAMAFIFPGLMLMQMLSGGAVGGAVASSVARAMGSKQFQRAQQLIWHALFIAVCAGLFFAAGFMLLGKSLLLAIGARDAVLDEALAYGYVMFGGCISIWLMSLLSGVFRGLGEMRFPALLMA